MPERNLRRVLLAIAGAISLAVGAGIIALTPVGDASGAGLIRLESSWFTPATGGVAPELVLPGREGPPVRLSELRGMPVVINFWATWCVPCEVEMPELQALADSRPDVRVLAVNVGEPPAQAMAWLAARGLTLDVLFDVDGQAARDFAIRGQPTTFVISPEGAIDAIYFGPTTLQQLITTLQDNV
ncbi:MAG: TlpA family protein disulfide reductase [Pleurocapsa minor GSE-CHR-MK-17-07R]|nr:TlpA family protein disulfide reductase [Pleurocapsa minor GSE-CHR-MK 17-07R]